MNESASQYSEIRQILAADQRSGKVDPFDDQIWELNTSRGEPPGVALQTTYGLRAYGIRVFPRFVHKKIPLSDPRAFTSRPVLEYSAPNFSSLNYSPINSLDVNQKVWVPDSHTLVGQITLTNQSENLIQMGMEWVVLLNPLLTGSSMSTAQISVNTVLQGQTQHLYPVFFLTGGPQGSLSAFPSLGIELTFIPHGSRQFSWALSSLDSTDASFYAARKSTSYSLDNEQIKIEMLQKQQTIDFHFEDQQLNQRLQQSQHRAFQLLMPPCRKLNNATYVNNRLPDQGYNPADKGSYSTDWGIQRIIEIWEISRLLIPAKCDLVKELVQNLLDQQGNDGTIHSQVGWNGNITQLPAAPLLASIVVEIFDSIGDLDWLKQTLPALIRSVRIWFTPEQDSDGDGFPEWKHLVQTGLAESSQLDMQTKINLSILIQSAEWPSLAALLIKECQSLVKIARIVQDTSEIPWLEEQITRLTDQMKACWQDNVACYQFRDKASHTTYAGKVLHVFKQDGSAEIKSQLSSPGRVCIKLRPHDGNLRSVECHIKGTVLHHQRTVIIPAKKIQWEGEQAFAVTEEIFSSIKQISVTGTKKGDVCSVEIPDLINAQFDFVIPLWAGIPDADQALKMIKTNSDLLLRAEKAMPLFLKVMWLEGLIRYDEKKLAARFLNEWFLISSEEKNLSIASLYDLIPIKIVLQLLGIEKITDEEVILKGFNQHFPKVNVQYKKFLFVLQDAQTRIQNLNGESISVNEEGTHRIVLS